MIGYTFGNELSKIIIVMNLVFYVFCELYEFSIFSFSHTVCRKITSGINCFSHRREIDYALFLFALIILLESQKNIR